MASEAPSGTIVVRRRHPAARVALWAGVVLLALLLFLGAFALWLNTEAGRRYIVGQINAFETVAKTTAEALVHEYCYARKLSKAVPAAVRAVLQAMAPPKEAMRGQITRARRPAPPARFGPPWWDLTFVPLRDGDKLLGVIGFVAAAGAEAPAGSGKGLSEALVGLRQSAVERAAAGLYPGESADARRIRSQAELAAKTPQQTVDDFVRDLRAKGFGLIADCTVYGNGVWIDSLRVRTTGTRCCLPVDSCQLKPSRREGED